MPISLKSVYNIISFPSIGMYNIGRVDTIYLSYSKALYYSIPQTNGVSFLVSSLKGFAILAKLGINYP